VDNPTAFLLQPNGQIIVGGLEDGNGEKPTNPDEIPEMLSLARYNSDGSLDTTFGTDGVSLLNVGRHAFRPAAIALLSNGDYLAVGSGQGSVVEITSTGELNSAPTAATVASAPRQHKATWRVRSSSSRMGTI
jgi:hypothetical protein